MPVYNCAPFLDEAISSIRAQSHERFEFVIVNDGSTDHSLEIIKSHAREDRRLVVVDLPNGGIVAALNAGLVRCKGDYVARMDGDDVAMPQRLALQVTYLEHHPEVVGIGTDCRAIDAHGNPGDLIQMPRGHDRIIDWAFRSGGAGIVHPTLMVRRSALTFLGGYRTSARLAEDLDLLFRLRHLGRLENLAECGLHYRTRPGQTTHSHNLEQTKVVMRVLADAIQPGDPSIRATLAALNRRASWQATDTCKPAAGIAFAARALTYAPLDIISWRSLARSFLKARLRRDILGTIPSNASNAPMLNPQRTVGSIDNAILRGNDPQHS